MTTKALPIRIARGFARDEKDERRLRANGVRTIFRADKGEPLARITMRQGEYLGVVDGLKALADHRAIIAKEVKRLHDMGATVIDVETGLQSRTDGVEMLRLALAPKGISRERAAEFQAQSVKSRLDDGRMDERRAKALWHDDRYKITEFEEVTGWPRSTAYVKWGTRFKLKFK
jgi:hypothetical protein